MRRALFALTALTALQAGTAAQTAPAPEGGGAVMVTTTPRTSDEVLLNPGMGLYLQAGAKFGYTPAPDEWFMSVADIAYYRGDWSMLNPEEGVYSFDRYFQPIFDFWVTRMGKRVAFRFMSQNMHSSATYVTPKWVFDSGVPCVEHVGLYTDEQLNPVFWDERYLDIHCEFIRRLGEYLDGREGLEFIDIGSIGEWGEMHLARWTNEQKLATGFSGARYAMAYRRVIDAFAKAFPHTRVFLNVGGKNHLGINDYAALRSVHFRQDGLQPAGASYDCGEWLYKPYSRRGVMGNFEFHSSHESMLEKGWDLEATIEKALEAPISYLNTNIYGIAGLGEAPEEVRRLLSGAARRIGYRFVMSSVGHLPTFPVDEARPSRIPVLSSWRNEGVAPCYESYAIEWSLLDESGAKVLSEVTFPQTPTTLWWPGEEHEASAMLSVPPGLAPGAYSLAASLLLPETGERIKLALAGADADSRYIVSAIRAIPRTEPAGPVFEEGFEGPEHSWRATAGMRAILDATHSHGGKRSLKLEGICANTWNYASFRYDGGLEPAGRYRLTVWLLVEGLEPATRAPYVKIGVNGRDGTWLENYGSTAYDMKHTGTWQKLEVMAELPADVGSLDFAIERGNLEPRIAATLHVDDVLLEAL